MQTLILIAQLLPALIAAIKAIEEAIPGAGQGEAKLAAVPGDACASAQARVDAWLKGRAQP